MYVQDIHEAVACSQYVLPVCHGCIHKQISQRQSSSVQHIGVVLFVCWLPHCGDDVHVIICIVSIKLYIRNYNLEKISVTPQDLAVVSRV